MTVQKSKLLLTIGIFSITLAWLMTSVNIASANTCKGDHNTTWSWETCLTVVPNPYTPSFVSELQLDASFSQASPANIPNTSTRFQCDLTTYYSNNEVVNTFSYDLEFDSWDGDWTETITVLNGLPDGSDHFTLRFQCFYVFLQNDLFYGFPYQSLYDPFQITTINLP